MSADIAEFQVGHRARIVDGVWSRKYNGRIGVLVPPTCGFPYRVELDDGGEDDHGHVACLEVAAL